MTARQRGYVSGVGRAMLLTCLVVASTATYLAGQARGHWSGEPTFAAGPFDLAVERCQTASGRPGRVAVQMHLERRGGPVPLSERIRIDGVGELGTDWRLVDTTWLIRNELAWIPAGDYLVDRILGLVPATSHPGEARAIFEYQWVGAGRAPNRAEFSFRLPDGRGGSARGVRVEP